MPDYDRQVFLNVPFDARYLSLLRALVFSVHACGLTSRCALEKDDGGQVRVDKLLNIIRACRFGIHDLSRTGIDRQFRLPRFNMPLELGLFLGARHYGPPDQQRKACLILDREPYRYQIFCSDIAGQDIRAHGNDVGRALSAVRHWLQTHLPAARRLPGPAAIADQYLEFLRQLPFLCRSLDLTPREMSFLDYRSIVAAWLAENR